MRRRVVLVLQVVVPVLILAVLAQRFGSEAFRPALAVLSPAPLAAALLLGAVAVGAHAARWRLVSRGAGLTLGGADAVAEYYRASALNTVLPGGVAGDVLRAWRQRTGAPRGWRPGAVSVLAERAAGFCVLLGGSAVVLLTQAFPVPAAVAVALAVVAWVVARPSLRRLSVRDQAAVWVLSAVAVAALLGLTVVVAVVMGVAESPGVVVLLGCVLLAGTAVPVNLGGWGPREAAGGLAAAVFGLPAASGVALAAGYGLLAAVSVLPGFVLLGVRRKPGSLHRGRREVELDADVVPEGEAPAGRPQRVGQPVPALETQPGYTIAHE
jgi:glycosyltransferase 2 family protein